MSKKRIIAAAAGVATAAAAGILAAARASRDGERSRRDARTAKPEPSRNAYHVARDDDQWVVKAEGARRPVSRHKTKREAVQAGRARAAAEPPGKLVIHRADGTVEQVRSYEPSAE